MDIRFLVIEGNIGAGKTSLARKLADDYNAKLVLEQFADNPFLPKFYADQERYSFPLELSFLADRYNQIKKEVLNLDLFHNILIADYYFSKSAIFSNNTLKDDEYRLFRRLFDIVFESTPRPDLYIYLHLNLKGLLRNIAGRGREYEKNIDITYLEKIQNGYFSYLKQILEFPVVLVDTSGIDFVNNPDDYHKMKEVIFNGNYHAGINRVLM